MREQHLESSLLSDDQPVVVENDLDVRLEDLETLPVALPPEDEDEEEEIEDLEEYEEMQFDRDQLIESYHVRPT